MAEFGPNPYPAKDRPSISRFRVVITIDGTIGIFGFFTFARKGRIKVVAN